MTTRTTCLANGAARHFEPERFVVFADRELAAAPPWVPGICFNPACGGAFRPSREWQIYCSPGCERTANAEFRKWGARMALPLLVWRMGKYAPADSPAGELTRAARRYVTQSQSAWLEDRQRRAAGARR